MKKRFLKSVFVALALGLVSFACQNAYADSVATIKEIQGEVFIQPAGSTPETWKAVVQDTAVNNGDSVKTGNGSCLLSYADQGEFRLGANTRLTVQQQADTQDIHLLLGALKARVNKDKVTKPFQVVTPTAVGAIRGTDVDFYFNDQGQLMIDLHNGGPVQVYNDEVSLELELQSGDKIALTYNKETGQITVTNDGSSGSTITFSILDKQYTVKAGQSETVNVEPPAAGGNEPLLRTVDIHGVNLVAGIAAAVILENQL